MEVINNANIVNEILDNKEGAGDDIETIEYLEDINRNQLEIIHLLKEIDERRSYINQVKQKLYRTCRHNFIRDISAAFDDMYKWQCTKCHLYRGEFY